MTAIFRRAKPGHRTRSVEDDSVVVVDGANNKVLLYEKVANNLNLQVPLVCGNP